MSFKLSMMILSKFHKILLLLDGCLVQLQSESGKIIANLPSTSKKGAGKKREITIRESLTGTSTNVSRVRYYIRGVRIFREFKI